uniref:Protein CCSMST1 n=1 Tax=Felis catus TaxID=9685 RepID=A0ABI7WFR1_FELCA
MSRVWRAPATGAVRALRFVRGASRHLQPPPGVRAQGQPAAEAEEEDDPNRPIQFSSSKASPSRWKVQHSLGGEQQRPWWRVLPFSLSLMALVAWCFFRQETSTDRWLKQVLGEEEPEPGDRSREPGAPTVHQSEGLGTAGHTDPREGRAECPQNGTGSSPDTCCPTDTPPRRCSFRPVERVLVALCTVGFGMCLSPTRSCFQSNSGDTGSPA